ncbi:MAG: methyl-accepting chemotaxis protein [Bilophila sp.]
MSIRTRLLGSILGVLIVGLAGMSFWTIRLTEETLTASILAQQRVAVEGTKQSLSLQIEAYRYAVGQAAEGNFLAQVLKHPDDTAIVATAVRRLTSSKEALQGCSIFALINSTGLVVASSNASAVGKQNLADRDYFKKAMAGTFVISKASLSRSTGKPSFFIATPFRMNGAIAGVVYMTIDLDAMTKAQLKNINIGSHGYAFMSEYPGKTLSHPEAKRIFEDTSSFDWMKTMVQQKDGTLEYTFGGKDRVGGFATVPQTGWLVVLAAEKADVLSEVSAIRNGNIIAAICMLLLVAVVVIWEVRGITTALSRVVVFAQAVAGGDLTHELHSVRKDELGVLGRALQTMLEQLRTIIGKADSKTKEAEAAAEKAREAVKMAEQAKTEAEKARRAGQLEAASDLEAIVDQMASSSEQLSAQIEQASRGADVQRERASEAATAMEQMNSTVLEVARNATEAAHTSEKTRMEAVNGAEIVLSATSAILRVQDDGQHMAESLNTLGEQANGIGQILSVISDIADQTNLLALNAAIEAARAGDAGRGFAVVADEVRKLAEKTMTATKQVGDAIQAVQQGTQESIQVMSASGQNIKDSTELSEKAGEALKHIVKLVEGSADQVRAIAAASEEQSATSEEINRGTEEINRIASETAGSMQQSAQAVGDLASMAQQLSQLVDKLKRG